MKRISVTLTIATLVALGLAGCTSDDPLFTPWEYSDAGSFVVQDGDHVAFPFSATAPGSLDVTVTVTDGPAVDIFVMTASNYRQFQRDADQENTVFYVEGGKCSGNGRTALSATCTKLFASDWVIVIDNGGADTDQEQGSGGSYPAVDRRGPASVDYAFAGRGG